MGLKTFLRSKAIDITGYWMFKRSELPIGTDINEDLKYKIDIRLNTIFDVGANVGLTVQNFSKVFPQAKIYSFEPVSSTFESLRKNTRGIKNVECHKIAFSDQAGSVDIKLYDEGRSSLNSLNVNAMNVSEHAAVESIRTDTIDNFLKINKDIASIDLLKLDTEGFEIPVLKGASESLRNKKIKLIYVEVGFSKENERNTYFVDVQELLEKYNFSLLGYYEVCHWGLDYKLHYGNALYIHDDYINKVRMLI